MKEELKLHTIFRIMQTDKNSFKVQKLIAVKQYTRVLGFLWKKSYLSSQWTTLDGRGNDLSSLRFVLHPTSHIYKSLSEAKEAIKSFRKYPIYHNI